MGVKTAKENQDFKITGKTRDIFSDFNHSFRAHPNTGQISRRTNVDAVKLALRNLILTDKYQRLRNPDFGGNIRRYLFEQIDDDLIPDEMDTHIRYMVKTYEPRVRIIDVNVVPEIDQGLINISITFSILTSQTDETLDITLYRVR